MKRKTSIVIIAVLMVLGLVSVSFAGGSKTINVTATIPSTSTGMSTTVAKIDGATDTWQPNPGDIPIAFGTLTYDTTYNIFRAQYYYAVDVGVVDNTGTAWSLGHSKTSISGMGTNLDGNVNVTFMKQTSSTSATQLDKVMFANSGAKTFTKSQLSGGWLRIYYGIATGETTNPKPEKNDAPGALPIGTDKPAGSYGGTVTITLSP